MIEHQHTCECGASFYCRLDDSLNQDGTDVCWRCANKLFDEIAPPTKDGKSNG